MLAYFRETACALSDDEFEVIVYDMVRTAAHAPRPPCPPHDASSSTRRAMRRRCRLQVQVISINAAREASDMVPPM